MADEPSVAGPDQSVTPSSPASGAQGENAAASPPAGAPSGENDQGAGSPPAGETRESLLDVVQRAVEETSPKGDGGDASAGGASPAPAPSSDPSATSGQQAPPDQQLADQGFTPEELARLEAKTKARIEKLLGHRQELNAEVERLKALEPSAQAAESVQKFLRDNDIAKDDFLLTLDLAAAMRRGDFKTFYEGVQPYVKLAEEYLGISLPPDLQQHVQQGHMTTQAAALYNRERMDRQLAENQRLATAQRFDTHVQQDALTRLQNSVGDAVNSWEAKQLQTDPDYRAKQTAVRDTMYAVVNQFGRPQTPEQAVAIAQESLRRVNEHFRSWTPPRRATSRVPSSTGRTNGAAPEPKSLLEAVQRTIEQQRA
jgi:flagellar motility protein MotE (MotC chaperone)